MPLYFKWILAGQGLTAFAITFLVAKMGRGPKCGLGIGAFIGLVLVASSLITYAVQPIPSKIILAWSVSALIETALAGWIAALVYLKCSGGCCCSKTEVK